MKTVLNNACISTVCMDIFLVSAGTGGSAGLSGGGSLLQDVLQPNQRYESVGLCVYNQILLRFIVLYKKEIINILHSRTLILPLILHAAVTCIYGSPTAGCRSECKFSVRRLLVLSEWQVLCSLIIS